MLVKDSSGTVVPNNGTTGQSSLYVYVNDTDIGSGVDKIEVHKDSVSGPLVFSDDTDHEFGDYEESGTKYNARYTISSLASGEYFVKVLDQAGNYTLHPLPKEILCFPVPVNNSTISRTSQPRQGITYDCC